MGIGRSHRLVGRDDELAALGEWLAAARAEAGLYVLSGEPGVGKSRLAAEALAALPPDWLIVRGRATDRDRPTPFRAIAECLLAASRRRPLPEDPDARAFAAVLGHLVPAWRRGPGAGEPVVVVAEAVLRVLRSLAAPAPAVMLIEDVQWADPETLLVLEYLADNAAGEPLAVLATVRSDTPSPGLDLARDLASRRVARLEELVPLDGDDVAELARECLGGSEFGPDVLRFLNRAAGLPFLVEELVAAAARDGALVVDSEGRWALGGAWDQVVPDSYRGSVSRRLRTLGADGAHLIQLAAVAGLSADARLTGLAAGLPEPRIPPVVRAACDSGLLSFDAAADRVEFRHALVRDAVLADLLPGERAALAAAALDALSHDAGPPGEQAPGEQAPGEQALGRQQAWPGAAALPDEALELAVDLAEQAGELGRSARLLLALASRALASGGLTTAEACLRRAGRRTAGDLPLSAEVGEALLELLVLKGDLGEVARVAAQTLETHRRLGADPARLARVHLLAARAAASGGDAGRATQEAAQAARCAHAADDAHLLLSADLATAHAALTAGDDRRASDLARQVISSGQAESGTVLRAWMVVGQAERLHDLDSSAAAFEQARAISARSGAPLAELAALHELATVSMLANGDSRPLLAARERAEQLGAVGLVAQLDLQLAGSHALTGHAEEALAAAGRARDLARRLRQTSVEAMALMQAATAHATRESGPEMEAAAQAALSLADADPNVRAGVWGHARTLYALLREDRAAANEALGHAVAAADQAVGIHGLFWAPWALLAVLGGLAAEAAGVVADRLRSPQVTALPVNRGLSGYALAAVAGLRGDGDEARRLAERAEADLRGQSVFNLWRHLCLRLAAEAALRDGWGEPVEWLRECLAGFDSAGHRRAATACRALLSRAGAPVPRRRGEGGVPPELAALGITAREADVLALVGEGLSNREVGARLHLSPRTVEKHVERLLAKSGAANRSQLIAWTVRPAGAARVWPAGASRT